VEIKIAGGGAIEQVVGAFERELANIITHA
jgi:hypothetical protein